jgi:hypothetical protein
MKSHRKVFWFVMPFSFVSRKIIVSNTFSYFMQDGKEDAVLQIYGHIF